jgi:hypothetical protein
MMPQAWNSGDGSRWPTSPQRRQHGLRILRPRILWLFSLRSQSKLLVVSGFPLDAVWRIWGEEAKEWGSMLTFVLEWTLAFVAPYSSIVDAR